MRTSYLYHKELSPLSACRYLASREWVCRRNPSDLGVFLKYIPSDWAIEEYDGSGTVNQNCYPVHSEMYFRFSKLNKFKITRFVDFKYFDSRKSLLIMGA